MYAGVDEGNNKHTATVGEEREGGYYERVVNDEE